MYLLQIANNSLKVPTNDPFVGILLNSKYSFYKGQKLKIIDEMDSWYKIRIEDGKEMWGEKCNFVII